MSARAAIEIVEYDPGWPGEFESLKELLRQALGAQALRIEHVGSTAVPGLAAKPIIDIDIVIAGRSELPAVIARLAAIGYAHEGDLGVEDREAFRPPPGMPPHHPYVCIQGSLALRNHLAVRDYLRAHPAAAQSYGRLKRDVVERGTQSAAAYGRAKTQWLLTVLEAAGFTAQELAVVASHNR